MAIKAEDVSRLRAETGAGVMDCKRALEDSGGDVVKATALLKERGLARAQKKSDREAKEGVVESYIHGGGKIGALVELASETDFVARNPEFRELARSIAMQVAAMAPRFLNEDDVPEDERAGSADSVLMKQPFIKDGSKTIGDLVTQYAATTGENVHVRRFARFELGKTA